MNFINTIQLLIYKENSSLLERIDFDDDNFFLEPLLFAYFNSKKENIFSTAMLTEIMQGYFIEKEPLILKESFNKGGIAYVPNLGYFDNQYNKVDNIYIIQNSSIELLIHPIAHLKTVFRDFNENVLSGDKIEISKEFSLKHKNALSNALQYIKNSNKAHFHLIQQYCKKIVLFKTNPENTNSFASIKAHGIAFFNVYQEDYDEVFFVDDIAHQTGHIIMTTILFNRKEYFLIDENINIGSITGKKSEYRSFYILFHALYTYYTSIMCLEACVDNNYFDKRQTHEVKGRIGFYLLKYRSDLFNFESIVQNFKTIDNVLTNDGVSLFKIIANKYLETSKKYDTIVSKFDYNNQPYNFTYSAFIKKNPINDD